MSLSRFGVSMPADLLREFDRLSSKRGYGNRSEAVRDMVRQWLVEEEWEARFEDEDGERVAVVVIVYDHERSELSQKLTHVQHDNVGVVVTSLHLHMDHHNCLEVILLRGPARDVSSLGESLIATRGVLFGKLVKATSGRGIS